MNDINQCFERISLNIMKTIHHFVKKYDASLIKSMQNIMCRQRALKEIPSSNTRCIIRLLLLNGFKTIPEDLIFLRRLKLPVS